MQGDDHSSGPAITDRLEQPTRKQARATLGASLFGLAANGVYRAPVRYRPGRGALTAPFHPYHSAYFSELWRSVFCGTFPGSPPPDVIRRSALCSPDFPRQEINAPCRDHPGHSAGASVETLSQKRTVMFQLKKFVSMFSSRKFYREHRNNTP